jgi:hypothetical protein
MPTVVTPPSAHPAKPSPDIKQQQLDDTEQALTTLRSRRRVIAYLRKRWDVSERTVARWIAKVRAEWAVEATSSDRDLRRTDMRQTLGTMIASAMSRVEMVKDGGSIVWAMERVPKFTPDGEPTGETVERRKLDKAGYPIPMTRPKPDIRAALFAASQLRALDALDEAMTAKLIIDDARDKIPDLADLNAQQYEALEQLLKSVSPDGDIRALAGDLFRDPARSAAHTN